MGDHPQKVQKPTKDQTPGDPFDQLLPDLNISHQASSDIECETCGIRFSGSKAYEDHMQGKKHQKKVAEAKLMARNLAAENPGSEDDEDDDEDDDLHCEVCDKDFSGYMSYMAHVKGNLHAKNVKKQKLMRQLAGMPEVLAPGDQDAASDDADEDGILPKPYARCKICKKELQGPESYEMHLKSAVHKKKVKQSKAVQALKAQNEESAAGDNSGEDELFSKCEVCQKSFSGVVPYKIHMRSGVHKKSLEKKKVAEELKEHYTSEGSSPGYVCKECNKSFTDPVAFKCHLSNNSHEKQKAKSVLLEFLNAHPEIVIVYPLDKDESASDGDSDGADSSYYLICKLCHVSFSGPESAQDHAKSKKHASLKKEKKLQKLLKEQNKKSLNGNGDDKSPANKGNSENGKTESSEHSVVNNEDDFELI